VSFFACHLQLLVLSMAVDCSIYGHTSGNELSAGWIVVKVDFSQILSRRCDKSDYYSWSPTSGVTMCTFCMHTLCPLILCACDPAEAKNDDMTV